MAFDLLSTVEQGGCSVKLSPKLLADILADLPVIRNNNVLVDTQTHDDAGVYRLNDETALIVTTDFFTPICSNSYEFGQIAAANALSDVYAMGGDPLLVLNLMMFSPAMIPAEEFKAILKGGNDKVTEAGALVMGGHTIDDHPPKYGLAVVGTVHPDKLVTNTGAREGQMLILTKPLGTGVMVSAKKMGLETGDDYQLALDWMKTLNKSGKEVMQLFGVTGGTDITGFGLSGHAMQMADASGVSFRIDCQSLPFIGSAPRLLIDGCIPGAAWRNLDYVSDKVHWSAKLPHHLQMLCCDAQTSGGLLFAVDHQKSSEAVDILKKSGFNQSAVIGEVMPRGTKSIYFEL